MLAAGSFRRRFDFSAHVWRDMRPSRAFGGAPSNPCAVSCVLQAARDLLSGISMSQLFSQPSSSPPPTGFRPYRESSPPQQVSSPWKAPKSNNKSRARTIARWWERQTATELEITGTVEDVINPSLLVAGRAGEGGNMMAVASLRELWDEEKGRSRAAGGGSQLSAPPGLELAGSQNVWEPPEGLLTQDVRDTVEILARNVLQRNFSQDFRATERQPASQPLSQQSSASQKSLGSESPHADLTPSRSGLSQDSASVAGASSSPANYLPAHDGRDGDFVDQGLLDMLAVLRGSQSQGGGGEDAHLSSPTESKRTQSPSQNLSQQPTGTPAPAAVDRAEAIAVTQVNMPSGTQKCIVCVVRLAAVNRFIMPWLASGVTPFQDYLATIESDISDVCVCVCVFVKLHTTLFVCVYVYVCRAFPLLPSTMLSNQMDARNVDSPGYTRLKHSLTSLASSPQPRHSSSPEETGARRRGVGQADGTGRSIRAVLRLRRLRRLPPLRVPNPPDRRARHVRVEGCRRSRPKNAGDRPTA